MQMPIYPPGQVAGLLRAADPTITHAAAIASAVVILLDGQPNRLARSRRVIQRAIPPGPAIPRTPPPAREIYP